MKKIANLFKIYYVDLVTLTVAIFSFAFSGVVQSKLTIDYILSSEIILILLPTILTILSIVLSLPNELVCGIDMNSFRKISKRKNFNFLEMLIVSITIFVLYSLSSVLELVFPIWILSIISVFYTIIFLIQEIPLLLKNKDYILKIIEQGYKKDKTNDDLKETIQHLLMKDGMKYVYSNLKEEDNEYNKVLIEFLLSLQNDFLWKYLENISEDLKSYNTKYKEINIIEALEKLLGSIEDILNLTSEMNILEIYENEDHFYHVTRSMFSIYKVINYFKLENKNQKYANLFNSIFTSIRVYEESPRIKRFYYKILNAILINTLSEGKLWFVELLRDYSFREGFILGGSIEYMVFISNYLYYLVYLENDLTKDSKDKIIKFVNESANKLDGYVSTSFNQQLIEKLRYLDISNYSNILPELVFIYESNQDRYNWFERPSGVIHSTSYDRMFTIKILMNWWIALVLTDDMYHSYFWNNNSKPSIPKLSQDNKNILAILLNEKWFIDDEININTDLSFFTMFGLKNKLESYVQSTDIVDTLRDFKNNHLFNNIESELLMHQKNDEKLNEYRDTLKNAFITAAKNISFKDDSVKLDDVNKTMFSLLCDTRWSDDLIEKYAEQMPLSIRNIVFRFFKEYVQENNLANKIKNYDKKTLEKIISFDPDFKYAYIHEYKQQEEIANLIKEINKVKPVEKFQLPRDVFFKEDAIKLKFQYEDNESIVRRLTEDEVNQIIDRDYKQINGLYKYVEGANGNSSVLLTREKLQSIVSNKFFLSRIVFTYKIELDDSKFLYFELV